MPLPGCPRINPAFQQIDLRGGQCLARLRRWHHFGGLAGDDAGHQLALVAVTGNNRPRTRFQGQAGFALDIEPQPRLPLAGIGAMTGEAIVGEDGTDVPIEFNRRLGRIDAGFDPSQQRYEQGEGEQGARPSRKPKSQKRHAHGSWRVEGGDRNPIRRPAGTAGRPESRSAGLTLPGGSVKPPCPGLFPCV